MRAAPLSRFRALRHLHTAPHKHAPAPTAFQEGDTIVLRECARGGKSTLLGPLATGKTHGTRRGIVHHSDIIGLAPRDRVAAHTNTGKAGQFVVHHPTLAEYTLMAPRRCTPIYPKDASAIIGLLDVADGSCVLEAGTGNGALTLALARAVGGRGRVVTVDVNEDASSHAQALVRRFERARLVDRVRFYTGSVAECVDRIVADETGEPVVESAGERCNLVRGVFDGAVLDMPNPWTQIDRVLSYVKTDRFVVCYLPSVSQVVEVVAKCRRLPLLVEDVVEVTHRAWEVKPADVRKGLEEGESDPWVCRPSHVQIGHTAFLVRLRKCAPERTKPEV